MIEGTVESCELSGSGKSYRITLQGGNKYTLQMRDASIVPMLQPGTHVTFNEVANEYQGNTYWGVISGTLKVKSAAAPPAVPPAQAAPAPAQATQAPTGHIPASMMLPAVTGLVKSAIEHGMLKDRQDLFAWCASAWRALEQAQRNVELPPAELDVDQDVPY